MVAGVRIVKCHASMDVVIDVRIVERHASIHVVIGIRVVLCQPLEISIITFTCSYFAHVLHRGNTSFEVWYLHCWKRHMHFNPQQHMSLVSVLCMNGTIIKMTIGARFYQMSALGRLRVRQHAAKLRSHVSEKNLRSTKAAEVPHSMAQTRTDLTLSLT